MGGVLLYPKIIIDTNITFETLNYNTKTNNKYKYKYYNNESEKSYRDGIESKVLKSKYMYIEKLIYNKNSIYGNSVEIINLENNETIAKSIYYVNTKTRKVCSDLIRESKFKSEQKCLKPFNLILDLIEHIKN